jgi:Flp pilus assembly pilin Flp
MSMRQRLGLLREHLSARGLGAGGHHVMMVAESPARSPERGVGRRADLPTIHVMIKTYAYLQSIIAGLRDSDRGQTMAEYAVVLAVITVAIVGTLGFLAGGIKSTLNSVTAKL